MSKIIFYTSLFLLITILLSCDRQKDASAADTNDTIVVYNAIAYAREGGHLPGNKKIFKIIDTACINGNKRAKDEIAKGQYTYFIGVGVGFTDKKAEFIKKEFLAKGIRIDYRYLYCMGEPPTDKFGFECYEKAMTSAFKNKYEASRLDSIDKALIKIYQDN